MAEQGRVLVVDDERFNVEILREYLEQADYEVLSAEDGERGWQVVEREYSALDAVLLDRMMPGIDGLELLKRMKGSDEMRCIPVIMQTAMAAKHEVLEGLDAGAHYYLTKPFDRATLLAVVATAVADYRRYVELRMEAAGTVDTLGLMDHGHFVFRTLEEGRRLAALLAKACDDPERVVLGLSELLTNSVEHGNLGIGYDQKSRLNAEGTWRQEVERLLQLPEHAHKQVEVEFDRCDGELRFLIRDQGEGFDWDDYLEISPERAFDNHGRGIALAAGVSFSRLEYRGCGNEVFAVVDAGGRA